MTREDAIKDIEKTIEYLKVIGVIGNPANLKCEEALDMAISALSADVRVNVHGEWELCEDQDGLYGVCSKCGTDADFQHYGVPYPFCPNCGADMRGKDE